MTRRIRRFMNEAIKSCGLSPTYVTHPESESFAIDEIVLKNEVSQTLSIERGIDTANEPLCEGKRFPLLDGAMVGADYHISLAEGYAPLVGFRIRNDGKIDTIVGDKAHLNEIFSHPIENAGYKYALNALFRFFKENRQLVKNEAGQ